MATSEQIKALVDRMPELDNPPQPERKEGQDPKELESQRQHYNHFKGKLTGPAWDEAAKVYDEILVGGKESVVALIDLMKPNAYASDYKPRYVLHGLAVYTAQPGKEKQRGMLREALVARVNGEQPKPVRAALVSTLQTCGDKSVLPALAKLLSDEDLCDPAARAMVAIGGDAAEHLRKALGSSSGQCKLSIVQALGDVKDEKAVDALITAASDSDETVKLTALGALARTGSPKGVETMIKSSPAGEGWATSQATRAAFVLAEGLAASGKKADAKKIYTHLRDTRKDPIDSHIREAAEEGLKSL